MMPRQPELPAASALRASDDDRAPRPGAPVLEVRCDVFCGAVTVRSPEPFTR